MTTSAEVFLGPFMSPFSHFRPRLRPRPHLLPTSMRLNRTVATAGQLARPLFKPVSASTSLCGRLALSHIQIAATRKPTTTRFRPAVRQIQTQTRLSSTSSDTNTPSPDPDTSSSDSSSPDPSGADIPHLQPPWEFRSLPGKERAAYKKYGPTYLDHFSDTERAEAEAAVQYRATIAKELEEKLGPHWYQYLSASNAVEKEEREEQRKEWEKLQEKSNLDAKWRRTLAQDVAKMKREKLKGKSGPKIREEKLKIHDELMLAWSAKVKLPRPFCQHWSLEKTIETALKIKRFAE